MTNTAGAPLDRLVRLAATLFKVRAATVGVLTGDNVWAKAQVGLDEIPRRLARADAIFFDLTVRTADAVISTDVRRDPRFRDLAWIRESGLGFHASVPLFDDQGTAVGSFHLMDPQPREFTDADLALLQEAGLWAQEELAREADHSQAGLLQRGLFPAAMPKIAGWSFAGTCVPATTLAGDFFDIRERDGIVHLSIGDVMGKGLPAALVAATVRASLRACYRSGETLARQVDRTSRALETELRRSRSFVTLYAARLDPVTGVLDYVDAGHGLAGIVHPDESIRPLRGPHTPIGAMRQSFTTGQYVFGLRDTLSLISDGALDKQIGQGRSKQRVLDALRSWPNLGDAVAEIARLAGEGELEDDVTVLAIRREV
ncbi:MAG: PP2C family protein-serine/threonine phosphatase [Sporichthyaceae bacterium]